MRAPLFKHPLEAPLGEVGLHQIFRHVGEPEPGKCCIEDLEYAVENELAFHAHFQFTPILRWPNEYGMEYEEIFFPAYSDRLLIFNHPMPCNRYGYPRHLEPWTNFGGFEVNFLPEYKILHDAGYNIITYDMSNRGERGRDLSSNWGLMVLRGPRRRGHLSMRGYKS